MIGQTGVSFTIDCLKNPLSPPPLPCLVHLGQLQQPWQLDIGHQPQRQYFEHGFFSRFRAVWQDTSRLVAVIAGVGFNSWFVLTNIHWGRCCQGIQGCISIPISKTIPLVSQLSSLLSHLYLLSWACGVGTACCVDVDWCHSHSSLSYCSQKKVVSCFELHFSTSCLRLKWVSLFQT